MQIRKAQCAEDREARKTMYSMSNLVIALLIGGSIGAVSGWYLAMASRGDNKRKVIKREEDLLNISIDKSKLGELYA